MNPINYIRSIFANRRQERFKAWYVDGAPVLTSFGNNIYLSDFVNNAIDRVATEISKLDIRSVMVKGDVIKTNNDSITRLFREKPNEFQTTSDFLSSVEWLRRKNCNAFIYPKFAPVTRGDIGNDGEPKRRYAAFYPLNPRGVEVGTDGGAVVELRFTFNNGYQITLPYDQIIHLKWRRGAHPIAGGGDDGSVSNYDIIRTIDALDKTIQGLPKSIEASLQIKGVYHAKALADTERIKNIRDEFESHIFSSKSGIIATDIGGDFTPVNIGAADIPKEAMVFLKSVIEERYGVSAAILSGDYTGAQHSAFYQTAIEDFIIQFEQAFTACLFTARERDFGNRVKAYYSIVSYMDQQAKMELADLATKTGIMTLNQINEIFGVAPFEGGNRRLQSLNYASVEHVDKYQHARSRYRAAETEDDQ